MYPNDDGLLENCRAPLQEIFSSKNADSQLIILGKLRLYFDSKKFFMQTMPLVLIPVPHETINVHLENDNRLSSIPK